MEGTSRNTSAGRPTGTSGSLLNRRSFLRVAAGAALAWSAPAFAAPPAADGKVARDGFDLYYRTVGSGEPIVFLAGGPGVEVSLLKPVADRLAGEFACVMLEQRGTGRSVLPANNAKTLNLEAFVADLEALREALGLERLALLGNSWGMMLAMAYAAAYPSRVRAVSTAGSGPIAAEFMDCFRDNIASRLWPSDREAERRAERIKDADEREFEGLRAVLPGYFFDHEKGVRFARDMQREPLNRDAARLVLGALTRQKFDLRPGLRKVAAPVLLLQGRQDPAGEANLYEAHLAMANSRLRFIERCGHLPWVEQPREFYDATRAFFRETLQRGVIA